MQGLPHVEDGRYGYHPSSRLAIELAGSTKFDEVLLVGSDVPDLHDLAGEVRGRPGGEPALMSGLYWFAADGVSQLMVVSTPTHPGQVTSVRAEVAEPDHPLAHARGWMETWWKDAAVQRPARFRSGTEVVVLPGHEDGVVRRRSFQNGTWAYQVRVNGRTRQVVEGSLEPRPVDDDPWEWILTPAEPAAGLAATLTRAKLEGSLSDTVFSFRATRTKFR